MNKVCSRPFYRSPAVVKEVEQLAEKETKGFYHTVGLILVDLKLVVI
jgi:hypothetical protein